MGKHAQSIDTLILERIRSHEEGWVFTPRHFSDLGSRTAVASALKRHKQAGTIRQVARGLYDIPREHRLIGVLAPSVEAIAEALRGRDAIRLQPSGAYAANLLGLSEQVPAKIVFLTDGPTRRIQVGGFTIILKHTTPRAMATADTISGLVIQGVKHIGKRYMDDNLIARLQKRISREDKQQLLQDTRYAPAWIAAIMRKVAEKEKASQ